MNAFKSPFSTLPLPIIGVFSSSFEVSSPKSINTMPMPMKPSSSIPRLNASRRPSFFINASRRLILSVLSLSPVDTSLIHFRVISSATVSEMFRYSGRCANSARYGYPGKNNPSPHNPPCAHTPIAPPGVAVASSIAIDGGGADGRTPGGGVGRPRNGD